MNTIFRQLSVFGWRRSLLIILVIWFIVVITSILPMIFNTGNNNNDNSYEFENTKLLAQRLQAALNNLDGLKKQNGELRKLLIDIAYSHTNNNGDQKELFELIKDKIQHTERIINKHYDFGLISSKDEPNIQYEQVRRRLYMNVDELEFFMKAEIKKFTQKQLLLKNGNGNNNHFDKEKFAFNLNHFLNLSLERTRTMYKDLENLAEVDGYQSWREKEFEKLSNLIQRRLEYLQNPVDCHKAKKVVCNLNKGCGYGCQLHHLVFCLTMAYGTERTLILQSKGWRYNKAGWDEIFQPVSNSCATYHYDTSIVEQWPGENDPEIIHLSIIDNLIPTPEYVPPAIPEDISARLIRLHGDPIVWWVGQMLKYLLRPQQSLADKLQQATRNLNFKSPIVGIHVRRTDKIGTEAAFHSIDEYMSHVNDYYDRLELMMSTQNQQLDVRRVYIATDDPKVITAAKRQYPQYEIIGDTNIAKIAAVSTRYTERSLFGIILDIYFLSKSDFIVCTFSSQVCRVAYELMQTYGLDATNKFRSLDDIYYFGGGKPHIKVAHMKHNIDATTYYTNDVSGVPSQAITVSAGEINLEIGDKIHIAGNHWNGYSKGKNLRTNQMGLFPSFKVDDQILTARFPTYPYVSNFTNTQKYVQKYLINNNN